VCKQSTIEKPERFYRRAAPRRADGGSLFPMKWISSQPFGLHQQMAVDIGV
jgi:hypothetical protein